MINCLLCNKEMLLIDKFSEDNQFDEDIWKCSTEHFTVFNYNLDEDYPAALIFLVENYEIALDSDNPHYYYITATSNSRKQIIVPYFEIKNEQHLKNKLKTIMVMH